MSFKKFALITLMFMRTLFVIAFIFSTNKIFAAEDYAFKWNDAKVRISELSKQCENKRNIQTSTIVQGKKRVLKIRCNIQLPIDRIQAVDKFPDVISANGSKLRLNYSAYVGAFEHTLHVTLIEMKGLEKSDVSFGLGVVAPIPVNAVREEQYKIEEETVAKIAAEIRNVLAQSNEEIVGKIMLNPLTVSMRGRSKLLLPVEPGVFLEVIRKNPKDYGLDFPENVDFD